ncbi:MAG TPA: hypothetical protein VFT22_43910 [Kofleriaceae bacterium]|nr:hypothetical protein [Kofleriaceae bacterium]
MTATAERIDEHSGARMVELIDDERTGIDAIGAYLDGLDGKQRWREVGRLDRAHQRALYDKAAHARPIDLAHFVGEAGPLQQVIHDGVNTLPVPRSWRRFQKRFCRPAGEAGGGRLFGYNEGPSRGWIGPGFFVALPTADRPLWSARGGVVVDYFQVPDGPVAEGWPRIVPNDWRLSRLVYHQTRDFLRRVSQHVSIGAAYKRERPLDHYFVLCRQA